jgi:hypothetical protein
VITGVSTGALMAPFAFLGPDDDEALRNVYTTTRTRDIFKIGSVVWQLLVPRFVVWNMGLIASSGHPEALELFRKVMLASASIPVAFPPVMIDVELEPGGRRYDEMHVDGGVGARVFLNAGVFRGSVIRERGGQGGNGFEEIFVIHNGQLILVPEAVDRSLSAIAVRVIDSVGRTAAVGDLFRIYTCARRERALFQWITIPEDVDLSGDEVFDPVKMQALYDVGFRLAVTGGGWSTVPPGQRAEP